MIAVFVMLLAMGCNSQKSTANADANRPARGERGQPPSVDDVFKMDANKDGKLSKDELKGPLARDFSKIDTDNDGFITRKELENAPKPERGQRPPRQ